MATNPLLDIQVRQRQSTNVPLPFAEMYQLLSEKQKRYDTAEAYERQQKSLITNFSSAIPGHNAYIQQLKNNYLESMMALHNSSPDKGSGEYVRKMQDNVDAFMNDPNYNLIKDSNAAYEQFIKTSAEHMAKGQYSAKAAEPYLKFQGVNPDGTLEKLVFAGLRPKVDLTGTFAKAWTLTPQESGFKSYPKGNTVVTLQESGRKPEKLKKTFEMLLGKEGLDDYMEEHRLSTPDELETHLNAQAVSSSDYKVSTKIDPNYEEFNAGIAARRLQLDEQRHALEMLKIGAELRNLQAEGADGSSTEAVPLSGMNNNLFDLNIANSIDDKGNVTGLQNSPWYKNIFSEAFPDLKEAFSGPTTDNTANKLQTLIDEQNRNASVINANTSDKLDPNQVRLRYKTAAKVDLPLRVFKSSKDAAEAMELIKKDLNTYTFWKIDGESAVNVTEKMPDMVPKLDDPKSGISGYAQGKLNAFNSFGPNSVVLSLYGDAGDLGTNPVIVASRGAIKNTLADRLATQEYKLAKAYYEGVPVSLPYYIDPAEPTKFIYSKENAPNGIEVFWRNFDDPQSSRFINIK
jgi:hypothetical protein